MNCDIGLYAGLAQAQSKLHTLAARLTETEKRLAALESALAAAERLAPTPASSMPDAIEQTEVVPKWRRLVDQQHQALADMIADGHAADPLTDVLEVLASIHRYNASAVRDIACIVAVCEQEVGGGWRAEPAEAMRPDGGRYTVEYLIYALAWTATESPSRWRLLGNRAAAWLRSLCEDGAA